MAGLAAGDQPVDALEVQVLEPAEERLRRDEAHGGGHLAEVVGAPHPALVLDRHAHPDVLRPRQGGSDLCEPLVALRQDLEGVVAGLGHHGEDLLDELERDVRVEEVAHRVHEDHPRPAPPQRLPKPMRPEPEIEALLVGVVRYAAPALSERLGVAVGAARGNLRAPGHGVPRCFRPFDGAAVCQGSILFRGTLNV